METLKYAILGLLMKKDMTGYELTKEFNSALFEFWNASHSQIYPKLKALTKEDTSLPLRTTEAAVSSHELSIPNINTSCSIVNYLLMSLFPLCRSSAPNPRYAIFLWHPCGREIFHISAYVSALLSSKFR